YDALSRITQRTDRSGNGPGEVRSVGKWFYDGLHGVGKIARTLGQDGFEELYFYDTISRTSRVETALPGTSTRSFHYTYDPYSRESTRQFPSGYRISREYNAHGYLHRVKDAGGSKTIWDGRAQDARQNYTQFVLGNGLTTKRRYSTVNGHLESIQTGSAAVLTRIQNLSFDFDTEGNLLRRASARSVAGVENFAEIFTYDNLHRLRSSSASGLSGGPRNVAFAYDALGNIKTKSDASNPNGYSYNKVRGAGVHAVTQVRSAAGAIQYSYDFKGNMTKRGNATLTYALFNKPTKIAGVGFTTEFDYGPQRRRYRQRHAENGGAVTTTFYYSGRGAERVVKGAKTLDKSYVDDFLIHIVETDTNAGNRATRREYLHGDHLGSTESITSDAGTVVSRLAYDTHGRKLNGSWERPDSSDRAHIRRTEFSSTATGFTGHEHLANSGLIHMNGRVYDPVIGRFLSPDPFVQIPYDSQSYNRYTYVLNNPLSYTDPSGNFLPLIFVAIKLASYAYTAYNVYDTVSSGYEDFQTLSDGDESDLSRGIAAASLVANVGGVPKPLREFGGRIARKFAKKSPPPANPAGSAKAAKPAGQGVDGPTSKAPDSNERAPGTTKQNTPSERRTEGCNGSSCESGLCSFEAGTLVATDAGLTPIEQLEVGQLVLAKSEETGEEAYHKVLDAYSHRHEDGLVVTFESAQGQAEAVVTTSEHPFFVVDDGFVRADQLEVGEYVVVAGGRQIRVSRVDATPRTLTAYNLEVDGFHTFFVGEQGLWVHNECEKGALKSAAAEIREAGVHPAARNQRVVAVGEDASGNLFAGSSKFFDKGQRAAADALGIKRVPSRKGNHAEENLLDAVPDLRRVGTDKLDPCPNCLRQLIERGVKIDN
ncbi:MAG: polymorphic toxin-type HINT domain-containing protein, partial [Gammaproteobacteria bacterium]